jgi:hypothetical protein
MKLKDVEAQENCIIVGDFNTTLHQGKKKGRSIVGDQFRKNMEDLISKPYHFDVKPSKGKYTWNYKRIGVGHITATLDHFLIHNPLLFDQLDMKSYIIPWGISDH